MEVNTIENVALRLSEVAIAKLRFESPTYLQHLHRSVEMYKQQEATKMLQQRAEQARRTPKRSENL
jgi:hypothetical protein